MDSWRNLSAETKRLVAEFDIAGSCLARATADGSGPEVIEQRRHNYSKAAEALGARLRLFETWLQTSRSVARATAQMLDKETDLTGNCI